MVCGGPMNDDRGRAAMNTTLRQAVDDYTSLHEAASEERNSNYAAMARQFYDLATDFYEFGWGQSFHFAPRLRKESFRASILHYEQRVGQALNCRPGMSLLDLGCGVGGPMRTMAREFGAHVTGININGYQIERGRRHNRARRLDHQCRFVRADFARLPLERNSFDGAYEFQATCHAPDRRSVYAEIFRVLKPGASFVGDEWCLTPRYDDSNPAHRRIKKDIEIGNGLPDVETISGVLNALGAAGFELVEHADLASTGSPETPWYLPLAEPWSAAGIQRTRLGRRVTRHTLKFMESVRLAPRGSAAVSEILNTAADALVAGGQTGIFTPLYFLHARKPD
jgi:sterol 24-C-methyltransferase